LQHRWIKELFKCLAKEGYDHIGNPTFPTVYLTETAFEKVQKFKRFRNANSALANCWRGVILRLESTSTSSLFRPRWLPSTTGVFS
jgi:hypothetical protein